MSQDYEDITLQPATKTDNSAREVLGYYCLREIINSLHSPVDIIPDLDEAERLFIVKQQGIISILNKHQLIAEPFLNMTERVLSTELFGDQRGLLGFALDPNFSYNGHVFVYYSTRSIDYTMDHKSRLSRFQVMSSNPEKVNANSEVIVLDIEQPGARNNGGKLLFGDDGFLYVFTGDGGGGKHTALNKTSLLGKVLRINVTGSSYSIPPDNPFTNQTGVRPEIYAYGLRNPWRCGVDRVGDAKTGYGKGRIFCGDVGQDLYEEINLITSGGNYGWGSREGPHCHNQVDCAENDDVLPIFSYPHSADQAHAVIGGHVYRGNKLPKIHGKYIFTDFSSPSLTVLYQDEKNKSNWKNSTMYLTHCEDSENKNTMYTLAIGEDKNGELYLLKTSSLVLGYPAGVLYRVDLETREPTQAPTAQGAAQKNISLQTSWTVLWFG